MAVRRLRQCIGLEDLLWLALLLFATISRFWDLGSRALHHDESLHTYYSWRFADVGEYVHFPLGHGPFLYHANALIYTILGASDVTSRVLPALVGVVLVGLPWLLRGRSFLGPWGALATGFMLLISPAFLYYTRYIRHDPYMAAGSLLLVVAMFRYLERPQRRWIITAFACVGFLLANHELILATFLGMVLFLWGALLVTRLRPLIPVHGAALALLGAVYALFFDARPWPEIPWSNPTDQEQRDYYAALIDHPFVWAVLIIAAMFLTACVVVVWWQVRQSDRSGSVNDRLFGDATPNTINYGVYHALRDPISLLIGGAIAVGIFVLLFTSLFTNMHGLATGTWATDGTLLYWLGQHDVRRGDQPWFYFITLGFQYEWVGIFLATAGLFVVIVRSVGVPLGKPAPPNLLFSAFCAWWFVFMFLVLSWAGEKMPWLIMHFALPAFLVGGALVNEMVEGWRRHRRENVPSALYGPASLVAGLTLLAVSWFVLAAARSSGRWPEEVAAEHLRLGPTEIDPTWWYLAVPPLAALLLIGVAAWRIGPRRAAYATLAATFVVLSAGQTHHAVRAAFINGDSARETLIYNTVSPDVPVLVNDLQLMSDALYGDRSLRVTYDRCTEWPLHWYLRDFSNRQVGTNPSPPPSGGPDVVIGAFDLSRGCEMPDQFPGYTTYTYLLRWHEPETQVYRRFAIAPEVPIGWSAWTDEDQPHDLPAILGSVASSLRFATTQEGQLRLIRLIFFRELPAPVLGYKFNVYVRNDLVPLYIEEHFE